MTERTDELRDLFRSVTGTEEVTDEQELSDGDAPDPEERLVAIVGEMRERYEFATDRPTETYVRIVRLYHEGATDEEIAARVGLSRTEAIRARLDVHLVRDGEAGEEQDAEYAELAAEAEHRSRQASRRFRTAFEELLTDADISGRLTERAREDELKEVTDDAEVGVDF